MRLDRSPGKEYCANGIQSRGTVPQWAGIAGVAVPGAGGKVFRSAGPGRFFCELQMRISQQSAGMQALAGARHTRRQLRSRSGSCGVWPRYAYAMYIAGRSASCLRQGLQDGHGGRDFQG